MSTILAFNRLGAASCGALRGSPHLASSWLLRVGVGAWFATQGAAFAGAGIRAAAMGPYQEGSDFFVAAREPGSLFADLPIFAARKGVLRMEAPLPAPTFNKVPGAEETAFVLTNVLGQDECDQIIALTESMGYQEDAPVSLARSIRRNENCVWVTDDAITETIFSRCAHLLPQSISLQTRGGGDVQIGPVSGLNNRWRLYKYGAEDIFKEHTDGAWPASGIRDGKVQPRLHLFLPRI